MKKSEDKQKNKDNKTKKRKNKIVSFIQYAIIVFMVIFNVVFIMKAVRHPNKTPDFLGFKTFVIVSGSMKPNIDIGDMVIVKVKDESYEVRRYYSF